MNEPYYDPSERDDRDLTIEEFKAAMGIPVFPTITIPDPAAVGKWLDEQVPMYDGAEHNPSVYKSAWWSSHWGDGAKIIHGRGDTPEALLADIRRQLAENDPVEKLRKEWIAAGRPPLE